MSDTLRKSLRRPDFGLEQHDAADVERQLACSARDADALAQYERELRQLPVAAEARYRKGRFCFDNRMWEEAQREFQRACELLPDGDAECLYWLGRTHEQLDDLDKADEVYTRALATEPRTDRDRELRCVINYTRALVRMRTGRCASAQEDLNRAIAEGRAKPPDELDAAVRGTVHAAKPLTSSGASAPNGDAVGDVEGLASTSSDSPSSLAPAPPTTPTSSSTAAAGGRRSMCRKLLANAYYFRGLMRERSGDHVAAFEDLSEAVGCDPDHADAYFRRAAVREELQHEAVLTLADYGGAIDAADAQIKTLRDEHEAARLNGLIDYDSSMLATRSRFMRKYLLRRGEWRLIVCQHKFHPDEVHSLAEIDWVVRELDLAVQDFTRLLRFEGAIEKVRVKDCQGFNACALRGEARLFQARAHLEAGRKEEARKSAEAAIVDLTTVLRLNGSLGFAFKQRADAYLVLGNKKQARDDYERAVDLEPDFAESYFRRATDLRNRDRDNALAALDQAIRLNSRDARSWYNRGLLRQSISTELSKAIEDFAATLNLEDNHVHARYELGRTYGLLARQYARNPAKQTQYREEEIKQYSKLIDKGQDFDYIFQARADAKLAMGDYAGALEDRRKANERRPELLKS